jgi:hypothetical protein
MEKDLTVVRKGQDVTAHVPGQDMDAIQIAEMMAKSGYFKDIRDASQAFIKIIAGRELGIGAIAALKGVNIDKDGKISYGATAIAAAIKSSGRYDFRVKQLDNQSATLVFFEQGKEVGVSAFTMIDAKAAGLLEGPNKLTWTRYPRNMLFARALTNGQRWFAPNVGGGQALYTPEEMDMPVDEEGAVMPERKPLTPLHDLPPTTELVPISTSQRARLFATLRDCGVRHEDFKVFMGAIYGIESTKDILVSQYDGFLTDITSGKVQDWLDKAKADHDAHMSAFEAEQERELDA